MRENSPLAKYQSVKDNLIERALVKNMTRNFDAQVYVADARYTWRPVPEDYVYPGDPGMPFYINLLGEGKFCGTTYGVTRPENSFCYEHNYYYTRPVSDRPVVEHEDGGGDEGVDS